MSKRGYEAIATNDSEDYNTDKPSHPTTSANFLSLLTFWWMNSIFREGSKRPLNQSDFQPLHEKDKTRDLTERLQNIWNDHVNECNTVEGKQPKLWKCVYKSISFKEILLPICFWLTECAFRVSQPLVLGFLLRLLSSAELDRPLAYACYAILTLSSLSTTFTHYSAYTCDLVGMRLSSVIKGVIYLKILLISQHRLLETTKGNIIDLISNDLQRIELAPRWICTALLPAFEFIAVSCLLLFVIGWQTMLGILLIIMVTWPCLMIISSICARLRQETAEVTDRRISIMNELVCGIRALKALAWEKCDQDKVQKLRRSELWIILKKSSLLSVIDCMSFTSGSVATYLTVSTFVLTGNIVPSSTAFMLLPFISLLRLSIFHVVAAVFEIFASLRRIEKFLLLKIMPLDPLECNSTLSNKKIYPQLLVRKPSLQRKEANGQKTTSENHGADFPVPAYGDPDQHFLFKISDVPLTVSRLTCNLNGNGQKYLIQDISFEAHQKSLTVITGQVRSGKSTLLAAIAGEVVKSSGQIACPGTIAYVPQTSWVFSGTLRENVLFGESFDEKRYAEIIDSCSLREDIVRLPNDDLTFIGEHGILLSGGQRARVSLARAMYADADVYLLDNPLSTVDGKVSEHIFHHCVCKLLQDKIEIMVTYTEVHMKEADQVVVLHKGSVAGKGSFRELHEGGRLLDTITEASAVTSKKRKQRKPSKTHEENIPFTSISPVKGTFAEHLEISEEEKATGKISSTLYWDYFRAEMHPVAMVALVVLFLITQGIYAAVNAWLSHLTTLSLENQQDAITLSVYASLVATMVLFGITRAWASFYVSLRCAENIHNKMVTGILRAPVLFFDTNPAGRILNRFSKDIGRIDEVLPVKFLSATQLLLFVFTAALLPSFTNFWLLLVFFPLFVAFICLAWYFLKTSRELMRWQSICHSPVFTHFSETMDGLDTIRTRKRERNFIEQFYRHQDLHSQVFSMVTASTRWLAVRADILCTLLISTVTFSSVLVSQHPALAGLALAYVIETAKRSQYAVRQLSEVENLMTSVERAMAYVNLEPEPGYDSETLPPMNWPGDGHVSFRNIAMRYYPNDPLVLKNLTFEIRGKTKLGIVGRTGDGKSSIVAALLRMPEAEGDICIDGMSIKSVQLQESRKCVSVLSQTPVIFSESIRKNLDPTEKRRDDELWNVLEEVNLKGFVENLQRQLDYELLEGGENLSVGERQLLCLARTLLQQSKIVILDEPTAHVDPSTEKTIWSTVHEKLKNSTVIAIAHRLNTIKDCDVVSMLREGQVAELDTIKALLGREKGIFYNMATSQNFSM